MNDSRYPYTYACDYIRGLAGYQATGMKLSRGDASQIMSGIAEAMGQPNHEQLARTLADYYTTNSDSLEEKNLRAFMAAILSTDKEVE